MNATLIIFVEDQLSNNEVSSDEELLQHLVDNSLDARLAQQAVSMRDEYLNDMSGTVSSFRELVS